MSLTDGQLVAALAGVLHMTQFMPTKKWYTLERALVAAAELVARAPKALSDAREAHGSEEPGAVGHRKNAIQLLETLHAIAVGKHEASELPSDARMGIEILVDQIIAAARSKE